MQRCSVQISLEMEVACFRNLAHMKYKGSEEAPVQSF